MMNELINTLNTEQCSLVVLHEGKITTFQGLGLRSLYHLEQNEPELLYHSKTAIKALGLSAAKAMIRCCVQEVFASLISQQAYDILTESGIKVQYETLKNHTQFLDIWEKWGEEAP